MGDEGAVNPEQEAIVADSVGLALLVVLDTLNPAERLAFVLHDLFDVSFDEIAPIVGRTPTAARQLASRARRRVQGKGREQETQEDAGADLTGERTANREIVAAFLAAARNGDFAALLAALDPDVTLRADAATVAMGASVGMTRETRGAAAVAQQFAGRARAARLALLDGEVGAAWTQGGEPRVVFAFTSIAGKIAAIEMLADPERLRQLDVAMLSD